MDDQELIRAIERLTEKMDSMSGNLGRGTSSAQPKPSQTGNKGGKKAAPSPEFTEAEKRLKFLNKQLELTGKLTQKEAKERDDLIKSISKEEKAREENTKDMKNMSQGLKRFGKDLLMGNGSVAGAFDSLGSRLGSSNSTIGKALSGFAAGVGFMVGQMQSFADDARKLGGFADLGAFRVGSIRQAKLMSGLGDSFIKVIEQSEGGFKAFGKNSQESVEALSELARGMRVGSGVISRSLSKNLGPELTKTMDKAARQTAAMGMTQEDQANLMGALSSTIALTAKSEKEAQQMMVKQYAETTASARTLSDTFGTSAKEIIKSIENFKRSTSGKAAELQGVKGAEEIKQALQAAGVSGSEEDLNRMALAMAKGQTGAAATYVTPENMANFQAVANATEQARQAGGGTVNAENLARGMQGQRSTFEQISKSRENLNAKGQEGLMDAGVAAGVLAKKLELQARAAAGDAKAREELAKGIGTTTEANNIKSMDNLTDSLNSLRNVILGLTAGIVALTGAIGASLVGGGIGAILSGGGGILGKVGGALKDKFGGALGKLGGAGKVGEGASKIGSAFEKVSGAAGKGMSSFGDFLGKLGSTDALKGAGVLALLGGALALSAHGFKTFGDVKWEGMLKGTVALGGLVVLARFIGAATTEMVKGAAAIAILGAAMWVAGKGFQTFNDLSWEGIAKGGVALVAFGVAAGVMGAFLPAILMGSLAIGALGLALAVFGAGAMVAAKAAQMFSEAIVAIGSIDGENLIRVGAGLAAVGLGMVAFTAGMLLGTAGGVVSGIASLFGVKSPLERVKEFVPFADKISLLGTGIKNFGEGVLAIGQNIKDFDGDALSALKDKLLEFAQAGASDEVKLTAQYLTAIGNALTAIGNAGDITLPTSSDMTIPNVSADMVASLGANESIVNTGPTSALTPEALEQLMSYLSSMQNDLAAIRGNTRVDPSVAPVRLT